jgi:exonuclease SbcC
MDGLKERLESRAEIETKLSKIAELDAAVDSAGYDREEHRAVEAEVAKLADAERRIREIEIAESTISEILRNVKNLEGKIDSAKADLDDLSKRRDELATGLPQPGELEKLIESLEESRERLSADLREAAISLSQVRSKLDELKKTKACKVRIEKMLDEIVEREKLHRLLAEAMGKSGVPAFVISQALPEIEREADELLALLSGDEMSLKLSTFENRENLELRIADRNGERPYESYSGGESFRVDFALRVALSRFLAHRSGSELSMLIVDEGFGTQDTEGLALLIESLRAIESEFALILVITHIENLKGEFDQVVEVGKIPGTGSRIRTYV